MNASDHRRGHTDLRSAVIVLCVWAVLAGPARTLAQDADAAPPQDPFANSPLLEQPKTAERTFDAVVLMLDLANIDLARAYLDMLMKRNPTDDEILRMREKHGAATFLRLANTKELQPLSTQLLARMNAAFRKQATNPARVDQLIQRLKGQPAAREIAILQLRATGPVVMPRIIELMGQPENAEQRDLLVYTLTRLGQQMLPAVRAALNSNNDALRSAVLEVLGRLGDEDDVPYLLFPAFSPTEPQSIRLQAQEALATILYGSPQRVSQLSGFGAAERLRTEAEALWRRAVGAPADAAQLPDYWIWNPQRRTVQMLQIDPAEAMLYEAHRFAHQALLMSPDSLDDQATFLAISLGRSARRVPWDAPLPTGPGTAADTALAAGPVAVSAALRTALQQTDTRSALAAAEVLAALASPSLLRSADREKSTLIAALNYPDQRVQFAAARIAVSLEPSQPFRGSPRVVEVLARALMDSGRPHAVVVDPNTSRAATMGGILREMGFSPEVTTTGRNGFTRAVERGDTELIALHVNTIQWPLSTTVANLRADARTALTPIIIYGPESTRYRVERMKQQYGLLEFVIESRTTDNVAIQVRPFLQSLRTPPLGDAARKERTRLAMTLLAHIAALQRPQVFDLTLALDALDARADDPEYGPDAMFALAGIPAARAQSRLQEIVTSEPQPVALRAIAARQLAYSIQRYGLLLTSTQVGELRPLFESAADPEFRTALAVLSGVLQPNRTLASERLRSFPVPPPTAAP